MILTLLGRSVQPDAKSFETRRLVDEDDDDDNFKCESAQPVPDTFCELVPELSRKLQLEHHQCIRLLKAVYGLVNAPRKWYHRVATDLRNMKGEKSVVEPCLWTFRDENAKSVLGLRR